MRVATRRRLSVVLFIVGVTPHSALAVERHVFITSTVGPGNLASWAEANGQTGAAAGDAVCQARATAAGLANPPAFRAWLSTSTADAACRVQGFSGTLASFCGGMSPTDPAVGPWVRPDGEPFAERLAFMTAPDHMVYQPILYDEHGTLIPDPGGNMWTGTYADGSGSTAACLDWSSASAGEYGSTGAGWSAGGRWTYFVNVGCDFEAHLICLEIGPGDPLVLERHLGELAFVSSVGGTGDLSSWPDAGGESGIAAGDAICQARATAAGLPAAASFVAWLSDSTTDARDRVKDAPVVRVDGFRVAFSRYDLLDGSPTLGASLNVTELGGYLVETPSASYVWTGTVPDGSAGTTHCDGWTTESGNGNGGDSQTVRFTWTLSANPWCYTEHPIYCFSTGLVVMWDDFEEGNLARWSATAP